MPFKKGQPLIPGAKKKKKWRKGKHSKYHFEKASSTLRVSMQDRAKPSPVPRTCTCTCADHKEGRNEKRSKASNVQLRRLCEAHLSTIEFEKESHQATVCDCDTYHVEVRPVSDLPFASQTPAVQAQTLNLAVTTMEQVRTKLGLSVSEYNIARMYWGHVYCGVPMEEGAEPHVDDSENKEAPPPGHKGRSTIWQQEWEKLHVLRGIADEMVISSNALRRIFMVCGVAGLSGVKFDRMKNAMDLAVSARIKVHDLLGPGGENVGVWLEVADVIRQMVMAANGRPGVDCAIVLTGDGR